MLGASKNGRLKASDLLTLFELVIPLIVLEIFFHGEEPISPKSKCGQFLQKTGDLVQCTRVVRDGHTGWFAYAYARYTQSSNILFNSPIVKHNHHYALHIPQQLKLWGPLFGAAEFAGEGLIGILQKNPTNNGISEIHSTLMRRVNGLQELIAGHPQANEVLEGQTEENEEGNYNVMEMDQCVYLAMMQMLTKEGVKFWRWNDFPHPPGAFILSCYARKIPFTKYQDRRISTTAPNNVLFSKRHGHIEYAMVKGIFQF
ncbi:hypothetical protein O181_105337 [Austropuccinia psidii MF-1]|uniref:Uncharacterized protein n=1 Tax=Austropuccinia psidii MF-1 TaxID=1389203 RepID=A0A9Q3JPV6_9BASI|nr:hypothetical protein [Austropuccinia psidii MF-1]